ncbi:helix-turn-helix domain-containing protein [Paraliobacillus zengyii]|uniref:helix-turn-helix domain-containing protein n=1 Tax=Paraliobacillus zengyii TaxID=2213194 RepID=UPI000E3D764F|nr:helix-turn-helix transcriptional regulator [Paraliobacillus zengyii]
MTREQFKRSYGQYIQNQRNIQELSQEELAYQIGISTEAIGRIERGITSPSLTSSLLLEEKLHLNHTYIKKLLHHSSDSES